MSKFLKNFFGKKDAEIEEYVEYMDDDYVVVNRKGKVDILFREEHKRYMPSKRTPLVIHRSKGYMGLETLEGRVLIPCECEDICIKYGTVVIWRKGKLEKFFLSELLKED